VRIFRISGNESSGAPRAGAAYLYAMVTSKTATGSRHPQIQGAESLAGLPPPARARRLEKGRASAVPSTSNWRRLRGFFFRATGDGKGRSEEKVMEALLMNEPAPEKLRATPEARTARGAAVFAALWLALAVGSPLIVRYGPSPEDRSMAALATRIEQPRCATAPEFGYSCPGRTLVARDARSTAQPDL
jgi:hypothetical protein